MQRHLTHFSATHPLREIPRIVGVVGDCATPQLGHDRSWEGVVISNDATATPRLHAPLHAVASRPCVNDRRKRSRERSSNTCASEFKSELCTALVVCVSVMCLCLGKWGLSLCLFVFVCVCVCVEFVFVYGAYDGVSVVGERLQHSSLHTAHRPTYSSPQRVARHTTPWRFRSEERTSTATCPPRLPPTQSNTTTRTHTGNDNQPHNQRRKPLQHRWDPGCAASRNTHRILLSASHRRTRCAEGGSAAASASYHLHDRVAVPRWSRCTTAACVRLLQ